MANYDRNTYAPTQTGAAGAGAAVYDQGLRSYMLGIYNYMVLGLGISALVAVSISMLGRTSPVVMTLYASPLKWVVMLAPLAFVLFMSFRMERMSPASLLGTFLAFSAVMGLSLGSIFFVFKLGSIVNAFLATAAAFGAMSLWGYTTKRNLTGMGTFLVMGLFGVIIVSLLNVLIFKASGLTFALNILVVLISAGLTAWDTQRLKEEYDYVYGDAVLMSKASIMGALSLYLNFINMFQSLLSLFGDRE
ncbi:MAG: Bax inhibitor-1/YccA family protein [Beijerinckiaceae bacterium]